MDHFSTIAAERRALADDLEQFDAAQWSTPSLCSGWTTKQVATHLVMPFELSLPRMILGMVRHRGDFNKMSRLWAVKNSDRAPAELVATLRDNAEHRFTPPGLDSIATLSDIVAHGQDIRRPLGLEHRFDEASTTPILHALVDGTFKRLVPAERFDGLSFRATDTQWSSGSGEEVNGTAEALLMSFWGRTDALDDLDGPGAATLAGRVRS
jgi:uncharacterized protein (TIGR03083 family)